MYAFLIATSSILINIMHHILFFYMQRVGWHMRSAACALMYKKVRLIYILFNLLEFLWQDIVMSRCYVFMLVKALIEQNISNILVKLLIEIINSITLFNCHNDNISIISIIMLSFIKYKKGLFQERLKSYNLWLLKSNFCRTLIENCVKYFQTLKLSSLAMGNTTPGQIVNLGATDVIRFDWVCY